LVSTTAVGSKVKLKDGKQGGTVHELNGKEAIVCFGNLKTKKIWKN